MMRGPSSFSVGPAWCFERFGKSETTLPEGRVVHIAGEHEDHYDPDFYIYNDVIVIGRDGSIAITGYPREISWFVQATVEGSLSEACLEELQRTTLVTLQRLDAGDWEIEPN